MHEMFKYAAVMFVAGLGIPMLAALNAGLGQRIGSPISAALVLFAVAFTATALVVLLSGAPRDPAQLLGHPGHLYLGGTLVAFYVLTITWAAPHFGVGNAVFFVLLGQLVSAALIDRFGLMGAPATELSPMRLAGIGTMALGLALALKG